MSAFILSNKQINVLINAAIKSANRNDDHIRILNGERKKFLTLDEAVE